MPQPQPYSQNIISFLAERILTLFTSSTLFYSRDIVILLGFIAVLLLLLFFVATKIRSVSFRTVIFPNAIKIMFTLVLLAILGIPYRFGAGDSGIFMLRKLWNFNPVFRGLSPQYIFDPLAFILYAVLIYGVAASLYHILRFVYSYGRQYIRMRFLK